MSEKELIAAVQWYITHKGRTPADKSVFTTWICGYFHTFPRRANEIMVDMVDLELVSLQKGIVTPI